MKTRIFLNGDEAATGEESTKNERSIHARRRQDRAHKQAMQYVREGAPRELVLPWLRNEYRNAET